MVIVFNDVYFLNIEYSFGAVFESLCFGQFSVKCSEEARQLDAFLSSATSLFAGLMALIFVGRDVEARDNSAWVEDSWDAVGIRNCLEKDPTMETSISVPSTKRCAECSGLKVIWVSVLFAVIQHDMNLGW